MREIGSMIAGQYEVLEIAGRGGMATVYRVQDHKLERELAIKEVPKNKHDKHHAVITRSALAEIHLLKNLTHVGLTYVIDIIESDESMLIVMEYVSGVSLDCLMKEGGAQSEKLVVDWGKQLCGVLHYLHTRKPSIIYRDVKPANILIQPDGLLKLVDFGIARTYKKEQAQDTVCLGTKGYAAPEQFGGQGQTDPRTDVYGVGVTLYHLVTGCNPAEEPYEIRPIREHNPELSVGLEKIILTCTKNNPAERYQSCDALRFALEHIEQLDVEHRYRQKRTLWRFSAACVGLCLSLSMGFSGLWLHRQEVSARYQHYLELATLSTRKEDAAAYYGQAIALKPGETQAYLAFVDYAKKDGKFTVEEEAQLRPLLHQHETAIAKGRGSGEVSVAVGKLYWHYFDYGSHGEGGNDLLRMESALEWFERAIATREISFATRKNAMLYRDIAQFYQEMMHSALQPPLPGAYERRFHDLLEAMSLRDTDPMEEEDLSLTLYQLAMDALAGYANALLADGVTPQALLTLSTQVVAETEQLMPTTRQNQLRKDRILARKEEVHHAIEHGASLAQGNVVDVEKEE